MRGGGAAGRRGRVGGGGVRDVGGLLRRIAPAPVGLDWRNINAAARARLEGEDREGGWMPSTVRGGHAPGPLPRKPLSAWRRGASARWPGASSRGRATRRPQPPPWGCVQVATPWAGGPVATPSNAMDRCRGEICGRLAGYGREPPRLAAVAPARPRGPPPALSQDGAPAGRGRGAVPRGVRGRKRKRYPRRTAGDGSVRGGSDAVEVAPVVRRPGWRQAASPTTNRRRVTTRVMVGIRSGRYHAYLCG